MIGKVHAAISSEEYFKFYLLCGFWLFSFISIPLMLAKYLMMMSLDLFILFLSRK
jgi:hypothetical protein